MRMTFHKSLSAASASNSFPNSFYSLMYDGEMMDKSSLKLNFRICGGLCNMLQIMTNSCCCLNMLLVLKILFITALMGKRNKWYAWLGCAGMYCCNIVLLPLQVQMYFIFNGNWSPISEVPEFLCHFWRYQREIFLDILATFLILS